MKIICNWISMTVQNERSLATRPLAQDKLSFVLRQKRCHRRGRSNLFYVFDSLMDVVSALWGLTKAMWAKRGKEVVPWTTGSGRCRRLKNFKTPFFRGYQKFPSLGNSNGSRTTLKNFSKIFFWTSMVTREVQSFFILEGATDPLIK